METDRTPSGGHWYLVTGLIVGLAIGLVVSLLVWPMVNREALPAELGVAEKDVYRLAIARSFAANPDPLRAGSRIGLLADGETVRALQGQAQTLVSLGGAEADALALVDLAAALQALTNNPEAFPVNPAP